MKDLSREELQRIHALSRELAELTGAKLRETQESPPEQAESKRPRINDLDVERARRGLRRMGRLPR